jgi:hypothetical protein
MFVDNVLNLWPIFVIAVGYIVLVRVSADKEQIVEQPQEVCQKCGLAMVSAPWNVVELHKCRFTAADIEWLRTVKIRVLNQEPVAKG